MTHLPLTCIYDLYQSAHKFWITVTGYLHAHCHIFVWFTTLVSARLFNLYLLCVARVNGFLSTLKDKVKHKSACRTRSKRARWNYYLLLITARTLLIIKREKCLWPTHTPFTRDRARNCLLIFLRRVVNRWTTDLIFDHKALESAWAGQSAQRFPCEGRYFYSTHLFLFSRISRIILFSNQVEHLRVLLKQKRIRSHWRR